MNNRNPFIPNIPTAQGGHWSDRDQIYNHNNVNNNQQNGQIPVPFTAHQQMSQSHHQHLYNVGYTTASSMPSMPTLPLQTNSSAAIFESWANNPGVGVVNLNSGMNYSYQQINSCYQQQNQQIVNSPVMHQIVSQTPRGVQLALDTSHFVHFPMNLSPPAGMVPLPLNSRSSSASMSQFSSRPSDSNNSSSSSNISLSLNSRSPSSSMVHQFSVSPPSSSSSSLSVPISLESRSSGTLEHLYNTANSQSSGGGVPISFNSSRVQNSDSSSNYVSLPLSLNVNSRSTGSSLPFSIPSSPPGGSMSRSPASMSPFSASSSSPSPTLQLPINSRLSHGVTSFSMSSPNLSSFNSNSSGQMIRVPQNSPSPNSAIVHGHGQNSRSSSSSSAAMQQQQHALQQQQQQSRSPAPSSGHIQQHSSRLNQEPIIPSHLLQQHSRSSPGSTVQQHQQLHHQSSRSAASVTQLHHQSRSPAPMPHNMQHQQSLSPIPHNQHQQARSPAPVAHVHHHAKSMPILSNQAPLNLPSPNSIRSYNIPITTPPVNNSVVSRSPPPPAKVKKPRAPRAPRTPKPKKTPTKPIPVNVSTLSLSSSPSAFPMNPNIISTIANSWPSHMFPVPVSAHLSSHIKPRMNNNSGRSSSIIQSTPINPFPLAPLPIHNSPNTSLPLSLAGSRTTTTANSSNIPYRGASTSTTIPSPVMPTSVIRSTSVIQTSPNSSSLLPTANRSPSSHHMGPVPPGHQPPPGSLVRPPISPRVSGTSSNSSPLSRDSAVSKSPVSSSASRFSVLDYALERAGIPSNASQEEIGPVFQEAEILQLVGEIPDQTNELQLLNPTHQLTQMKSKSEANEDSWERDAFNRALGNQAGDEDLVSELNRFYCPPSPPSKDSGQLATKAGTQTSSSTSGTTTTTPGTSQSSSSASENKTHSTAAVQSGSSTALSSKSSGEKAGATQSSTTKPPAHVSDDDDDCEVILVKLSDKKRKVPPGARRGLPPKKMQAVGRGREIVSSSSSGSGKTKIGSATPNEEKGGKIDPRKAMVRAAYPNGRYVSVAPKTTVPIPPPRTSGTSNRQDNNNKKTTLKEIAQPRNVVIKSTARKSTSGVPHVHHQSTSQNASKGRSRATATRSQQAQQDNKSVVKQPLPVQSSSQRPKRQASEISRLVEKPIESKVTRQTAKALKAQSAKDSQSDKKLQLVVQRLTSAPDDDVECDDPSRPPIKLKISLNDDGIRASSPVEGRTTRATRQQKTITTTAVSSRPGPKSKKDVEVESKSSKGLQRSVTKKAAKHLRMSEGSEDDLLIVEEYLADSDESFDIEGERDEASSESETEPESDGEVHNELGQTNEVPSKNVKSSSAQENTTEKIEKSQQLERESISMEVVENFSSVLDEESEIHSNISIGSPFTKIDDDILAESTNAPEALKVDGVEDEENSSDTDNEALDTVVTPVIYEMPKPKVIIKGTKEDADKAVADMRRNLSLLSTFKLPFFGK